MAGTTATMPVPALNDALPTLDTRGSALASHGLEAHLQVTYHEVKGTSGYAIATLMRPDARCAPFHSLQVNRQVPLVILGVPRLLSQRRTQGLTQPNRPRTSCQVA